MARGRNRRIAAAEAKVKYAPQENALAGLMQQAISDYGSDVRTTKGEARATIRGAKRAVKPIKQIYTDSRATADRAASDVNNVLATLGPAADVFKGATAREQEAQRTRIGREKSQALGELQEHKLTARAGRQYGLREARGTYRDTMQKLGQQLVQLGDQRGAYEAGRLGQLGAEAADRRWERKKVDLENAADIELENVKHENRLSEDAAKPGKDGKDGKDGSKFDRATNSETATAQDAVSRALAYGQKQFEKGKGFAQALEALSKGRPAVTEKTSTVGGKLTVTRRAKPGREPIEQSLLLRAALEQIYNGHITGPTQRKLKQRGLKPGMLGLDPITGEKPSGYLGGY